MEESGGHGLLYDSEKRRVASFGRRTSRAPIPPSALYPRYTKQWARNTTPTLRYANKTVVD